MAGGRRPGTPKTGGRLKGTPNKRKDLLLRRLQDEFPNYHPLIEMIRIAKNPESSLELQGQMHKEVCQYVEPKRKAIEVTGEDGNPLRAIIQATPLTLEEWKAENAE